jgi:hypothetical protein
LKVKFIDSKEGSKIIAEMDDYINKFRKFDLQSRLGTVEDVSKDDLVNFLSQQTLNWTQNEID